MRRRPRLLAALLLTAITTGASAQQAGWHYSPLPGEGDRAAMGCASGSDATRFACVAVRCDEDFTVGVHIYAGAAAERPGRWRITIDEQPFDVSATADASPYGDIVSGDPGPLIDALKNGAVAFLTPLGRPELTLNAIPLGGSLHAINEALYFCAPKTAAAPDGQDLASATGVTAPAQTTP